MNITFFDIILILSLLYLIINIIIVQRQDYPDVINYVSDDDIIIINSNNKYTLDSPITKPEKKSEFLNKKNNLDQNITLEIPKQSASSKVYYDKINDRYNRKLNNVPSETDLVNVIDQNTLNEQLDNEVNNDHINTKSLFTNENSLDFKNFSKSNRSQKLYKDTKTIAVRFNKNSIINDYKSELDYYENLKTPWWVENID